jgi:glycerol-3-phosphate acyltransferase PlsX
MKRLAGVDRPGIVTLGPQPGGGHSVVLDVGANTEVRPTTLAQYAVMGSTYARLLLGVARPRVAVLSNGEEATKGTHTTRAAHQLLRREAVPKDFDFIGYAEGRDFFNGLADVIVTDGFTGNVALKTTEGATRFIVDLLKGEVARSWRLKLGALLMRPAFDALKRRLEPDEAGGAPLLGVDGVVIICHGRSNARAIMNGVLAAARLVGTGLAPAIADAVERHRALWQDDGTAGDATAGPRFLDDDSASHASPDQGNATTSVEG